MTSSPPSHDAPHYNGRTLSPASPKPIHIPDVENIPVLHNQIDPVFNLVSTHMDQTKPQQESPAQADAHLHAQDVAPPLSTENETAVNGQEEEIYLQEGQSNLNEAENAQNSVVVDTVAQQPSLPTNVEVIPAQTQNDESQVPASRSLHAHAPADVHDAMPDPIQPASTDTPAAIEPPAPAGSEPAKSPPLALNLETGNIQALLDNLIASTSSAPTHEGSVTAPEPTSAAHPESQSPADVQTPISALPTAGLPARPPTQVEPSTHPNYAPGQDIQSFHNAPANATQPGLQEAAFQSPTNAVGANGQPPVVSYQQPQTVAPTEQVAQSLQFDPLRPPNTTAAHPQQHAIDTEQAYQDFLRAEANYVAEGTWDRFPQGSRLFVGNLFTEKVSKRMIWDMFSPYGALAQISMKNAYGFAQFVDPASCSRAMVSEEGSELGGRKIHLEISKPQKNTRNSNQNDRNRNQGRRSRSPDYNRGSNAQRPGSNAYNGYGRRDRDDYRPMRSPSPRGGRNFDRYHGRRSRSRSPYGRRYNRSPSPRAREQDDEASLPIPRRNPMQVPEVQIIVVDESDRTFVAYIQQAFRDRGLRCDVQQLPRGVNLQTLIKRQIIEGVRAVVKIYRKSQVTGKIPLQVFDLSMGMGDIRFDEYEELDATVAADVVNRAKSTQPPPPHGGPHSQPPTPQFPPHFANPNNNHVPNHPGFPPQGISPPGNANGPPNLAGLDPATIQKLLSTLGAQQQQGQQQLSPSNANFPTNASTPDLATLLSSVARQTPSQQGPGGPHGGPYGPPPPQPGHQQGFQQQQGYGGNPAAALANNSALAQLLSRAQQQGGQGQGYGGQIAPPLPPQQQQGGQNVQDIMAQLSKFGGGGR